MEVGHDIHTLECLFHVNEIYFGHVVAYVEGMKKGPRAMQAGAVLKFFSKTDKPIVETLVPRDQLDIPVTRIAEVHLKAKLHRFPQQKQEEIKDHSFWSDQLCMRVLACQILTDPVIICKNCFFIIKVCHSR